MLENDIFALNLASDAVKDNLKLGLIINYTIGITI
jgi:hypothetical protein